MVISTPLVARVCGNHLQMKGRSKNRTSCSPKNKTHLLRDSNPVRFFFQCNIKPDYCKKDVRYVILYTCILVRFEKKSLIKRKNQKISKNAKTMNSNIWKKIFFTPFIIFIDLLKYISTTNILHGILNNLILKHNYFTWLIEGLQEIKILSYIVAASQE